MEALEAYRDESRYYLRYRRDQQIFYTAGNLISEAPGSAAAESRSFETPVTAPMQQKAEGEWEILIKGKTAVPVLGVSDWAAFRDSVFVEMLPQAPDTGVVVSFDRGDYFFSGTRKVGSGHVD